MSWLSEIIPIWLGRISSSQNTLQNRFFFHCSNGGRLSLEKVTYGSKRGHNRSRGWPMGLAIQEPTFQVSKKACRSFNPPLPSLKLRVRTWKWMVGRLVSFWDGLCFREGIPSSQSLHFRAWFPWCLGNVRYTPENWHEKIPSQNGKGETPTQCTAIFFGGGWWSMLNILGVCAYFYEVQGSSPASIYTHHLVSEVFPPEKFPAGFLKPPSKLPSTSGTVEFSGGEGGRLDTAARGQEHLAGSLALRHRGAGGGGWFRPGWRDGF